MSIEGVTEKQVRQIEAKWGVTVKAARVNEDASALAHATTLEIAADHEGVPATMYVSIGRGEPELEWDVSGYPLWYKEDR